MKKLSYHVEINAPREKVYDAMLGLSDKKTYEAFLKELEEYGAPEALPKLEGRRMIVMVSPKRKK